MPVMNDESLLRESLTR